MGIVVTLVLGSMLLVWGMRFGRVLVRSSVTAKDLFKGRNSLALAFAMPSPAMFWLGCRLFDKLGGLPDQFMAQCYQLLVCSPKTLSTL